MPWKQRDCRPLVLGVSEGCPLPLLVVVVVVAAPTSTCHACINWQPLGVAGTNHREWSGDFTVERAMEFSRPSDSKSRKLRSLWRAKLGMIPLRSGFFC